MCWPGISSTRRASACPVNSSWRPEGNTHVAWAGKEGATILGIFLKPNIFADGRPFFTQDKG